MRTAWPGPRLFLMVLFCRGALILQLLKRFRTVFPGSSRIEHFVRCSTRDGATSCVGGAEEECGQHALSGRLQNRGALRFLHAACDCELRKEERFFDGVFITPFVSLRSWTTFHLCMPTVPWSFLLRVSLESTSKAIPKAVSGQTISVVAQRRDSLVDSQQ